MEYVPGQKVSSESDSSPDVETVIRTIPPITGAPISDAPITLAPSLVPTNLPSSSPSITPTSQKELYESTFPLEPEQKRAATTFTVLSDREAFNVTSLRDRTHYLSGHLSGTIWYDVNGDGIRGSALNRTLNAMEYDMGIGNVNISLVRCDDDTIVATTKSSPYSHMLKEGISRRKTDDPIAGMYSFPIDGMGVDYIRAGRYYVMFQAPMGYKIGGNTLPLGRIRNLEVEASNVATVDSIECTPGGGEGTNYIEMAEEIGDLDWEGYCARTVGCVEVDTKFDLEDRFTNLQFIDRETNDEYEGTIRNLVALPKPIVLNIGMAVQPWPLDTDQFSDAEFTIRFPPGMSEDSLRAIAPPDEEFSRSEIKTAIEETLATYFRNSVGAFKVGGFVLNDGIISPGKKKEMMPTAGRLLRRLRGLLEDEVGEDGDAVTYSFTTRGQYNPPPYVPLGDIVSSSINADPSGIIKSLQSRKVGVDDGNNSNSSKPALAPVFEQSTGAETRHLTLKKQRSVQPIIVIQPSNSNLASWSKIPIALLSLSIVSLIGLLLLRRIFGRLAVDHNTISTASNSLNNVKTHKKKKPKKVAHSYAVLDTSGEMNTKEHKRVKSKKQKVNKRASRGVPTEQCETQLIVAAEPIIENHVTQRQAQLAWEEQMQEQVIIMPVRPKRKTPRRNPCEDDEIIREQSVIVPTRSNRNVIEPVAQSYDAHVTQRHAQLAWEEQIREQGMIMPVRPKRPAARR